MQKAKKCKMQKRVNQLKRTKLPAAINTQRTKTTKMQKTTKRATK